MKLLSWVKALSLIVAVGVGLAACETIKPIVAYEATLTLTAPGAVVNGGETFTFQVTLSYQDQRGEMKPLAHQPVQLDGAEFGVSGEMLTDEQGQITLELVAPLLPEREKERDAWIRAHFDGTVIEYAEQVGRFSDANNSRYFNIKQSAPGRNNPGIPG